MRFNPKNIRRIQDLGDDVRISKHGHGHTKPYVIYVRMGVVDRQAIKLPPDSTVLGVDKYLGEIYLKIQVTPKHSEATITRYFYAFCNGEYMKFPNLLFLDTINMGGNLWFVFEDDSYPFT
jgi:hypothetical protein